MRETESLFVLCEFYTLPSCHTFVTPTNLLSEEGFVYGQNRLFQCRAKSCCPINAYVRICDNGFFVILRAAAINYGPSVTRVRQSIRKTLEEKKNALYHRTKKRFVGKQKCVVIKQTNRQCWPLPCSTESRSSVPSTDSARNMAAITLNSI